MEIRHLAPHLNRGRWAEDIAREFLVKNGMRAIESNYRCRYGEIDLIMLDGSSLVFVEVRYRKNNRFGGALASVDSHKQRKLRACAEQYRLKENSFRNRACRFDVISITGSSGGPALEWVKDAF